MQSIHEFFCAGLKIISFAELVKGALIYSSYGSRATFSVLKIPVPGLRHDDKEIINQCFLDGEFTWSDLRWISGFVSHK